MRSEVFPVLNTDGLMGTVVYMMVYFNHTSFQMHLTLLVYLFVGQHESRVNIALIMTAAQQVRW
jgi:hypothetical protein